MLVQSVFRTVLGQFLKEDPGKETDPLDVLPGFQAPVLNDRGQGVHQHVIGLLQLMGLLVHHVLQVMLMQVKLNDIMYAPLHHMRFKWLYNDVRGAQVKGTQFPFQGIICRNDHHRHLIQESAAPHLLHYLISIHNRHYHIQQHDCYIAVILLQEQKGLFSVLSFQQMILFLEQTAQYDPIDLHIIYYQNRILLTHVNSSSLRIPLNPHFRSMEYF